MFSLPSQINNEHCDVAVFRDRILGLGIDVTSWGIVLRQGWISNLVASSPKDMTAFIERMCGSYKFASDMETVEKQLEKAQQGLLTAQSQRKHLKKTLRKYKTSRIVERLQVRVEYIYYFRLSLNRHKDYCWLMVSKLRLWSTFKCPMKLSIVKWIRI